MRRNVYAEKDIAIVSLTFACSALTGQTNARPFGDARWDFDVVAFGLSSATTLFLL